MRTVYRFCSLENLVIILLKKNNNDITFLGEKSFFYQSLVQSRIKLGLFMN